MRIRIAALALAAALLASCSGEKEEKGTAAAMERDTASAEGTPMPEDMSRYRADLHRHYRDVFNDSNKYQYAHAVRLGIDPISDLGSAYFTSRPIVKVADSEYYIVDDLKHSVPYLVPVAASLLDEIGRSFRDSLRSKRMPEYRLKVTSLLRTPASVKSLRRVNRNATDSSAHQFATTFDISYYGFSEKNARTNSGVRGLREVLAEVLYDFRRQNRCMVKYEVKSSCFHVTVIK